MKIGAFFITPLMALFLFSCNKDESVGPLTDNFYPNSYILEFTNPSAFLSSADHWIRLDREKKLFKNSSPEIEAPTVTNILLNLVDYREERIAFDAPRSSLSYETYAQKVNQLKDNKFYGYSRLYSRDHILGYKSGLVINDTITNISVSCNKEFSGIPAENTLEEKFLIFYEDLLMVVKNGYKKPTGEKFYHIPNETAFPYALIGEPLVVFNQEEHPNISPSMVLYADNLSATETEYTFTIRITMKSGKVYTTECQL